MPRLRVHPDVGVLLVAIGGVAFLFVIGEMLEPPVVSLADAPSHEGKRVALAARVLEARHGERGRYLMLGDATHRLPALAGVGEGPWPGDRIHLVGIVTRDERGWLVSAERVDIVQSSEARILSPAEVAADPIDGARVVVRGDWRDGVLAGGGSRLRCEPAPTADGSWIAAAKVEYHERDASFHLQVAAWTRPA